MVPHCAQSLAAQAWCRLSECCSGKIQGPSTKYTSHSVAFFPLKIWAEYFHGCHTSVHKSEYNQRCSSISENKCFELASSRIRPLPAPYKYLGSLSRHNSFILSHYSDFQPCIFFISYYGTLYSIIKYVLFCVGWFHDVCDVHVCGWKLESW